MSGILIYTIYQNQPYFFVQRMSNYTITDLGGTQDENEHLLHTAIREFLEESNYQFKLQHPSAKHEIVHILKHKTKDVLLINGRYVLFICEVPSRYMHNLQYDVFDQYEYHDNIPRQCIWMPLHELQHMLRYRMSHPRLQGPLERWLQAQFANLVE